GLMTVHPQHGDPRRWFAALRELGDHLELAELSMGMSDDFEIAVEEGATIVRVGRVLFGER
ncbi:MAG: YggS family pyridoxal phosphate-dependent enzyme, partial [Actinobacteria bacterium]|nr:YggS family pyridoxal phosphate-dependent enzyme [Actinomycetota bacterium]